jgi:hypothetical protein
MRQRWIVHLFFLALLSCFFYVLFFGRKNNNYIQTFFLRGLADAGLPLARAIFLNYFLGTKVFDEGRDTDFFLLYFIYVFNWLSLC